MMKLIHVGVAAGILSMLPFSALAQDPEHEALKRRIMQEVEKKLQEEEARLLQEIEKLVEDELEASVRESRRPARGYLGVRTADIAEDEKKTLGVEQGVRIAEVVAGAPAEKAGLKPGDILVALDGKPVGFAQEFSSRVQGMAPGDKVKLEILRDGKKESVEIVLGEKAARGERRRPAMPFGDEWALDEETFGSIEDMLRQFGMDPEQLFERGKDGKFRPSESYRDLLKELDLESLLRPMPRRDAEKSRKEPAAKPAGQAWLGIQPEELSEELRAQLNLQDGRGILLAEVIEGSPAAKGELKKNDILVKIDDKVVRGETDVLEFMRMAKAGQEVRLTVLRKADEHVLTVTLGERKD